MKSNKINEKRVKYFIVFLLSLTAILLISILIFVYKLSHESPPVLFSFNDPEAKYKIVKMEGWDNIYGIEYKTTSKNNISYDCPNKMGIDLARDCKKIINQEYTVAIASSPVDLSRYLNREVKVDGKFVFTTQQCIQSKCTKNSNGMMGIDILSINNK